MAKDKFNQQIATFKLREPINEGRVMFTIDDEEVDQLFNKKYEEDVDYIHDGPDVYYVTDQNDLEKFIDYVESMGLDANRIHVHEYFKEDMGGTVTSGGEAYLPALNVPSKKQNPFKEDVLSGYTQDKNFRPGHTKDRGGFQYRDLWGLNESQDLEVLKQRAIAWSRKNRNNGQDSLEIQWFQELEDDIMNATTKEEIRNAILDVYYVDDTIFDKLGLMGLDYEDSEKPTDPLMKKSSSNKEELQRVQGLLDRANKDKAYSVMSSYEDRLNKLKFLVALEKKINSKLPLLNFADYWQDYVKDKLAWKGNANKFAEIASHVQDLMEPPYKGKMQTIKEMNQIVDEVFSPEDYKKVLQVIEKIKYTNTRLYNAILDMISDVYPHDYKEVEAQIGLSESSVPDNIMSFAKRNGIVPIVKQVARWAEKAGKRIVGGTAIGKNYSTLILDLTYQGGEIRINIDTDEIEVKGEEVYDYRSFVNAIGTINENYSRFRNETKTRTKPEQFHEAVKSVKRKIQEINKLYEYMERLKLELSEDADGLKYKKYTENAIIKIKEAVKTLQIKTKKLK